MPFLGVVMLCAAAAGGYLYWQHSTLYPSTDNAYVEADVVQLAPLVSGIVKEVPVQDFARVKSGDVVMQLDRTSFEAALKAAEARVNLLKSQGQQSQGQPPAARSPAAATDLAQAQAAVDQAHLDLEHTTIKAPADGIIGKVSVRPGALVKAGVGLFPLVETTKWWVDANFKETDIGRIKPGEKATVYVDLYPLHPFTGSVESIDPASTTAFSLLPPENASGNWVKLTQRFPVHIGLTVTQGDPELRVGASASVVVDTTSNGTTQGATK